MDLKARILALFDHPGVFRTVKNVHYTLCKIGPDVSYEEVFDALDELCSDEISAIDTYWDDDLSAEEAVYFLHKED